MNIHEQTLSLTRLESKLSAQLCFIKEPLSSLKRDVLNYLHQDERTYFSTLKYEKKQHTYLLGRYAAKKAISNYYGLNDLRKILIENGIFQQPIVQSLEFDNVQTSLAHSNDFAIALAFPEAHPMGIDLEYINVNNVQAIKSQMTEDEKLFLDVLPSLKDSAIFYTVFWTIKEALSKILKTGLMVSFEILEIKNFEKRDNFFISEFKYFFQYSAITFIVNDLVFSIVYPKNTKVSIDIEYMYQWIEETMKN